jgi:hypothetical protein
MTRYIKFKNDNCKDLKIQKDPLFKIVSSVIFKYYSSLIFRLKYQNLKIIIKKWVHFSPVNSKKVGNKKL